MTQPPDKEQHMAEPAECPTSCDQDCGEACHETHVVSWKRDHRPDDCPSARAQDWEDDDLELVANVNLADLSGFELAPVPDPDDPGCLRLELRHRCGWAQAQPFEGITGDNAAYLGNVVSRAARERLTHRCLRS